MDENRVSLLQISDDVCHKINRINEEIVNAQSIDDRSPKHFENIYSTSSEPTNPLSDGDDVQSSVASTSSCCAAKHSRKEFAGDKCKSKLVKKRKKKRNQWVLKFNCARLKSSSSSSGCSEPEVADKATDECVCTGYRRRAEATTSTDEVPAAVAAPASVLSPHDDEPAALTVAADECRAEPVIDLSKFNPEDYPIEDCDERARLERAREIAEGVDPPPGFSPKPSELVPEANINMDNLKALLQSALSLSALSQIDVPKSVHTQIDYIHCLVPDLLQITSSSFYWGKMDRYGCVSLILFYYLDDETKLLCVSTFSWSSSIIGELLKYVCRMSLDSIQKLLSDEAGFGFGLKISFRYQNLTKSRTIE